MVGLVVVVAVVAEAEAPRALKPCGLQLLQLQTLNSIHIHSLSLSLSPLFSFFFALLYFLSLLSLFLFWFWFGYIKKHKAAYFLLRPTRLFVAVWITLQSPFFFLSFYVLNNNITSEYSFIILVGVVRACRPSNCIVVAQEAKSCSKFFVNLF